MAAKKSPSAPMPSVPRVSLFELTEEIVRLKATILATLNEETGEIDPVLDEWLEKSEREKLPLKVEGYCVLITELDGIAKVQEAEAKRLAAVAKRNAKVAEDYRARLSASMVRMEITEVVTPRRTVTLGNSGGVDPIIYLQEIDKIPAEFVIKEEVVKPNTDAIREALKAGQKLEFAQFGERKKCLRI